MTLYMTRTVLLHCLIVIIIAVGMFLNRNILGNGILNFGDVVFPFYPDELLHRMLSLWNPMLGTGKLNPVLPAIPYQLMISALAKVGMPLVIVNRLIFVIPMVIIAIGLYELGSTFIPGRQRRTSALILTVFYLVSPAATYANTPTFTLSVAGFIVFLLFVSKGLRKNNRKVAYVFLAALSTLLIPSHFQVLALVLLTVCIALLIGVWFYYGEILSNIRFLILTALLSLLLNAYWIIPTSVMLSSTPQYIKGYVYSSNAEPFDVPFASLFWRIRLFFFSDTSVLSLSQYASFAVIALTYLCIPIEYLVYRRVYKRSVVLTATSMILTLLYTGPHYSWMRPVYLYLWNNLLIFQALRNANYYVLTLALTVSLLFALTVKALLDGIQRSRTVRSQIHLRKFRKLFLASVLLFLIGGFGVPGPLIGANPFLPDVDLNMYVPHEYFDLHDHLVSARDHGYRMIVFPRTDYIFYTWYHPGKGVVADLVLDHFSPIPAIGGTEHNHPEVARVLQAIVTNLPEAAASLMASMGIKYVFVHLDLRSNDGNVRDVELSYLNFFDSASELFKVEMDTPYFRLYRVNTKLVLPNVYGVQQITSTERFLFTEGTYGQTAVSQRLGFGPPFTIAAWINEISPDRKGAPIITVAQLNDWNAWFFTDNGGQGGNFQFAIRTKEGSVSVSHWLLLNYTHFVVGVANSSRLSLYIDGRLAGTASFRDPILGNSTGRIFVGHDPLQTERGFFRGFITNVQIYASALGEGEIKQIYSLGSEGEPYGSLEPLLWLPLKISSQKAAAEFRPEMGIEFSREVRRLDAWQYLREFKRVDLNLWQQEVLPIRLLTQTPTSYAIMGGLNRSVVVVNQQYNDAWVSSDRASEHFVLNGFANAWYLDSGRLDNLQIWFDPQIYVLPFASVSILGILVGTVMALLDRPKLEEKKRIMGHGGKTVHIALQRIMGHGGKTVHTGLQMDKGYVKSQVAEKYGSVLILASVVMLSITALTSIIQSEGTVAHALAALTFCLLLIGVLFELKSRRW